MCDDLTHEQLKRNAWDTCTPIGVQDAFDSRGTKLDMRNAPCCGTTLCKPIHLALCMDDISRALVMCQLREKVTVMHGTTVLVVDRWECEPVADEARVEVVS